MGAGCSSSKILYNPHAQGRYKVLTAGEGLGLSFPSFSTVHFLQLASTFSFPSSPAVRHPQLTIFSSFPFPFPRYLQLSFFSSLENLRLLIFFSFPLPSAFHLLSPVTF
jgi:hypothetical protein